MYDVFKNVLQFSVQAGIIVLAVVILRLILRKAPRSLFCALWALVAVRLIFPFKIESIFSLVPDTETTARTVGSYMTQGVTTVMERNPQVFSLPADSTVIKETADNVWNQLPIIAAYVWIIGVCLMVLYAVFSYLRLYRLTREKIKVESYFICDKISSPFILGIFRPKIILPYSLDEADKPYVLAHEKAHIKRRDHLWKPLGFLLLSFYWFNPLLWVAYVLLCRDIESACDERVIKEMGSEVKKTYATALINAAAPKRIITACPVAFGETGVKSRVKNILNDKKPAFWVIVITVILSIVIAVCFLTNPVSKNKDTGTATPDSAEKMVSAEYVWSYFPENTDESHTYSHALIRMTNHSDNDIAVDITDFRFYKNGSLLTPSPSEDDTMYYDYLEAGESQNSGFSLEEYLNELDTISVFRIEADCYTYDDIITSGTDQGQTFELKSKKFFETVSVEFSFPDAEERGDLPAEYMMDYVYGDINGDGTEEMVVLSPGPTSGVMSTYVGAYYKENHKKKYEPALISNFNNAKVQKAGNGITLTLTDYWYQNADSVFIVSVENGEVVLLDAEQNDNSLKKLDPSEAVNLFFQKNHDKFPVPSTQNSALTWGDVKAAYYGGSYLDGAEQVILLTDISGIDSFVPVGLDIRYEKCEYSLNELENAIDSITEGLRTIGQTEPYAGSFVQVALLDAQNKVEVSVFDMNDEKLRWFKDKFGDQDYLTFRNVTERPDEDIADVKLNNAPGLIYAEGRIVYISGDCGIIFYDIEGGQYLGRISYAFLEDLGIKLLTANASPDGSKIYLYDKDDESKCGVFDATSGMITTYHHDEIQDPDVFTFDSTAWEGFDSDTLAYMKDGTKYTLSTPGKKLANMELTVKTKEGKEKKYMIFE